MRTVSKREVRKSGIRQIDQGGRYDIPGMLRQMAREIERGQHPGLKNCCIVTGCKTNSNKFPTVNLRTLGTGTVEEAHYILVSAAHRLDAS